MPKRKHPCSALSSAVNKRRGRIHRSPHPFSGLIGMVRAVLLRSLCHGSGQLRRHDFPSVYLVTRSLSSPQASYSQHHLKYAAHPQPTDAQRRWFSRAMPTGADNKISIGPKREVEKEDEKDGSVIYYGPISSTIKKVKLLSLSTCCLSVSLGPVITFMTSPDMNVILKGAVASSVIFFSASTTAALHWFVSPYIHKLKWQPGSDTFEVEMMSWLATYLPRTLKFSDIRPAETNRPFVTFKANDSFYFVDIEHCRNKALLARLTPQKPPVHESAFKNL